MSNKKGKGKIKLGLILLLIVLVVITIKPSIRMKTKEPFLLLFNPVQERLKAVDSFLVSLNKVVINLNNWQQEITQLEREKMNLLAENAELRKIREENDDLRKALEMELQKSFQLKLVRLTGKRLGQEQIIVDKGQSDGIEKGMPVVNAERVVVGKITQLGDKISRVRLISHPESVFSAQLKDEKMEAEIKGEGNFGVKLDFIPSGQKIEQGQVVVTSALSGDYPAGLLVGEIKQVRQRDVKPFQVAEVDPYFEVDEDFLFIITDY